MAKPDHKIHAVVFDIGNVLIEWQPEQLYDRVIGVERRRALFKAVDLEGMNLRIDAGAPFSETVTDMARQHPDWSDEILIWRDRWIEMIAPAISGSVVLLRALRSHGVPVIALSNFGCETFEMARKIHTFLDEFDHKFISGYMKITKPDPEIYRIVEAQTGLCGDQLLFADDRPQNIDAASRFGWQTHLFSKPAGLRARLKQENLIGNDDPA